ncbi:6377_t:CDS:2, partial [Racocetra persica]
DDINTSYIQQGFVKDNSVFFSDNELVMDDSSFSSQSQYMLTPTLEVKKKEIVETIKIKLTQHNRKRKRISKEEKEEKEEVNGVNLELNGVNSEVNGVSSASSPA